MRLKAFIISALATAALVVPTTSAHAARGMEVALQDDSVFLTNSWYGRDRAFQRAQELGVTRLRVNMLWARTISHNTGRSVPADPGYQWGNYDALVSQAAAHGIKVQLTLVGPAPEWATGNHKVGVYKPNAGRFGRFAADVAAHFKGRVDRYAVWNEPNWKSWLEPHGSSPRLYRSLYKSAYSAIKRSDPSAKVLIGETSPLARGRAGTAPLSWLRAMVGHSRLKADGYAHHPYDYRNSPHRVRGEKTAVPSASLGPLPRERSRLPQRRLLRPPHGG